MALALMVLTWLVSTFTLTCTHYVDYAGAKMPQYGNGEYEMARDREYREHSHDSPSSLDYKFEEDSSEKAGKSFIKPIDNSEKWQKPSKKQKRPVRPLDDRNMLNKYIPEETVPKIKFNNRFTKRRPRLKSRSIERNINRRSNKFTRIKNDDIDEFESKIDDFHVSEEFIHNKDDLYGVAAGTGSFDERETTERIIRRKPRDRVLKSVMDEETDDEEDELNPAYRKSGPRSDADDYSEVDEHRRGRPNLKHRYPTRRPVPPNEDEIPSRTQKHYDDYKDYYDLKRLNNLKSKLPSLLRSKARVARPTSTTEDDWPTEIMPGRRLNESPQVMEVAPTIKKTTSASTITTTTIKSTVTTTTTTPKITTTLSTIEVQTQDLSLAEKSRLSILKKAQRKEGAKNETSTKKPPVLLQVTQKLHTVVMVEPPMRQDPWMRAREVSEDTPDRLERVKKLMRHKLVSSAKNIRDLTDNWDEMVCDYVDLSLLDNFGVSISYEKYHYLILFINILLLLLFF